MKYLNYISLFFITTIFLTSCEKDDVQVEEIEPLVGIWKLEKVFYSEQEYTLFIGCAINSTIEFKVDNTSTLTPYFNEGLSCVSESWSLEWEKIEPNIIKITPYDEDISTILNEINENIAVEEILTIIDEVNEHTYVIENELLALELITNSNETLKIVFSKVN